MEMKPVTAFKLKKRVGETIPDAIGLRVRKRRRIQQPTEVDKSVLDFSQLTLSNLDRPKNLENDNDHTDETMYVMFRRVPKIVNNEDISNTSDPCTSNNATTVPILQIDTDSLELSQGSDDDFALFAREGHTKRQRRDPGRGCNDDGERDANMSISNEVKAADFASRECPEVGIDDRERREALDSPYADQDSEHGVEGSERIMYIDGDEVFTDGWYVALEEGTDDELHRDTPGMKALNYDDSSDLDAQTVDYPSTPGEFESDQDFSSDGAEYERYEQFADEYDSEC